MAEPSGRELVERFARAVESKDFDAQAALLADDVVNEMPQSGERVRGKENWLAIARNYPGGVGTVQQGSSRVVGAEDRWVLSPSFSLLRIEGTGNVFTYVGTVRYSNDENWQLIAIVEVRAGKIARTTTWYAAPFEAPEWRAPYVERFESPLR